MEALHEYHMLTKIFKTKIIRDLVPAYAEIFNVETYDEELLRTAITKFINNTVIPRYQVSVKSLSTHQRLQIDSVISKYLCENDI